MSKYIIPVEWSVYSTVSVEAGSLAEAKKKFDEKIDELPLCLGPQYIEGSYHCTADDMEALESAQSYLNIGNVKINEIGEIES